MALNSYYETDFLRQQVSAGRHREAIGGMWEEIGGLQADFLRSNGLDRGMNVVDIGCGCLRAGVLLIDYLDAGRYYGIDLSEELLDAGYDIELQQRGLQHKLPRRNLLTDGEFRFERFGGVRFDLAIAQSVFTHLPMNHVRLCLARLAPFMVEGGVFFATFFFADSETDWAEPLAHERGGITTHPDRDPYHYLPSWLAASVEGLPWDMAEPEDWDHPRDQKMVRFSRRP